MPYSDPIKKQEYMHEYSKTYYQKNKHKKKPYNKEKARAHYLKNKDRIRAKVKIAWDTKRKFIVAKQVSKKQKFVARFKSKFGCCICKEKDPRCLDFHHIDETTKVWRISSMTRQWHSMKELKDELRKCCIMCANCHRKTHYVIIDGKVKRPPRELEASHQSG